MNPARGTCYPPLPLTLTCLVLRARDADMIQGVEHDTRLSSEVTTTPPIDESRSCTAIGETTNKERSPWVFTDGEIRFLHAEPLPKRSRSVENDFPTCQ